ncbi:hypothetical protein LEMLEM_LOCUS10454, partial [Lemmus lemmus]
SCLPPLPISQKALPQARRSPQKFQGGKWAPLKVSHKAGKDAALQMRFCPRSPGSWVPVPSHQHNFFLGSPSPASPHLGPERGGFLEEEHRGRRKEMLGWSLSVSKLHWAGGAPACRPAGHWNFY